MMLPMRSGPVFSEARNLSVPDPLTAPLGDTIVIHGVLVDAVHEHPLRVLTETLASPPTAPIAMLDWPRV